MSTSTGIVVPDAVCSRRRPTPKTTGCPDHLDVREVSDLLEASWVRHEPLAPAVRAGLSTCWSGHSPISLEG